MKVKKTKPFYILGYLLEVIIRLWQFGNFKIKIWWIWAIFPIKKNLCIG